LCSKVFLIPPRPTHHRFLGSTIVGGSSFEYHVAHAMGAIALGLCNVAVIAYGSTQRSVGRKQASVREINPYETPFRPFLPSSAYALAASRHMHQFGTTREQLAAVAVAAREWALLNPKAWEKKPLTIDGVLSSRMVSYPFTVRTAVSSPTAAAPSSSHRPNAPSRSGNRPPTCSAAASRPPTPTFRACPI
jgi:acetyl-CoA acetyltransferase